ncbi:MAG: hypothetical protein LBT18_05325 [Endomicrobium sp.]|jgi:hypothetical protein|nr:hypothetical protein [Endomicrobium sp.]
MINILDQHKGQSLLEALFVVVFTTVIMFAFIQICIVVVDDMVANETAFVAMRSAVVTKDKQRSKEVQARVKNYLTFFYPAAVFGASTSNFNPSHFVLSNKRTVEKYFKKSNEEQENESEVIVKDGSSNSQTQSVNLWKGKKTIKDYSGKTIVKETIKIYYFTRVLFGSLISKDNSFKNKRYQSARNRMFPSPDEKFYYKAFPGAKKFE